MAINADMVQKLQEEKKKLREAKLSELAPVLDDFKATGSVSKMTDSKEIKKLRVTFNVDGKPQTGKISSITKGSTGYFGFGTDYYMINLEAQTTPTHKFSKEQVLEIINQSL
jgi:hypothetical protein